MSELLHPNERLDDLGRKNFHIIQNPEKFCFGMDAVLLADFTCVRKNDRILDLGTGTGILPILVAARYEYGHITGLEIQEDMVDLASRSVRWNHLEDSISILAGDIRTASKQLGKASFDVVVSNPPYMKANHGLLCPEDARAVSRHEILCTLDDVVREASLCVKPGGHFFLVHRPHRLAEVMEAMNRYRMQPKRLRMVHPFADREANMVLIDSVRGGNPGLKAEPPLIVFDRPGVYTEEARRIYGPV